MIKRHQHNNVLWIDLLKPTQEEVREIMEEFNIHPNIASDLLAPTFKPTVELYKDFIYLILHFPALKHTHSGGENQEIDFIIGKDFIITSRYDTIDPIHKFSKEFDVDTVLSKEKEKIDGEHVFFLLVRKLYNSVNHELEYIQDSLDNSEEKIFNGDEKEMVRVLSDIGRDLLNTKQATNTHKETLESLHSVGINFFKGNFNEHMKIIIDDFKRIRHKIEINRESLRELRYTNDSLLSTKQNETMRILTIMAFVTFPLSLIASVFGMNTDYLPLVGRDNDFWIVVGIMLVLTSIFFLFFKYKKWL